jgi:hypothetical protein
MSAGGAAAAWSGIVAGAVGAAVAVATSRALQRASRPLALNHRGIPLPLVLGWAVFAGLWLGLLAGGATWALAHDGAAPSLVAPLSLLVVFGAGVYDDVAAGVGRGLVGHVALLLRGQVTPGIVKLVAEVLAAAVAALALGGSGWRLALGIPVMAGAADVGNLLDVRPGRCLKAFILAIVPLLVVSDHIGFVLIGAAALGAALAALPFDLGERGMLGDAGSNVLGFVVGIGLFVTRSTAGLAVALAVVLGLHALSETVTLSRIIRGFPPLRWADDLGRIRPTEPSNRDAKPTTS